ncbi:MAG: two-component system, OmpR family, sensor histidine kinase MprB [Gaiellaceae bacterium]|nr:two-component system, OmpR family, sensor histidine kinase MprB [Gaiellaceae bacterium]
MSLRARIALVTAAVVASTVVLASGAIYVLIRAELRDEVDRSLSRQVDLLSRRPFQAGALRPPRGADLGSRSFGSGFAYIQYVDSKGRTNRPANETEALPVDAGTLAIARGQKSRRFSDIHLGGVHGRLLTVPQASGVALQVARPLNEVDNELAHLRLILLLVGLTAIAVSAVGGNVVARATLASVRRLTGAAERVARTRDPSERVPAEGRDELSRLGVAFNTMLAELEDAIETQKRFVADASHELLTPLTSLQTNVEVLAREAQLPEADRDKLHADLEGELGEMRMLIDGLLELAKGQHAQRSEEVELDEVVAGCVEQARARFRHVRFEERLEPLRVAGDRQRLQRAIWNLIDNAAKWSDAGGVVEIELEGSQLVVRDHGPGISAEDLLHVKERFYRAAAARGRPGSGLGLAIAQDIATGHGATLTLESLEDGTVARLRFPAD